MPNKYYPVYLDLEKRQCIVIGGNDEALRKVKGLLDSLAFVTVIAPELNPQLHEMVESGAINWKDRNYQAGDLQGAFLAIVADTSDTQINLQATAEANERNVLVNVMDVTQMCSFIAPAIARRGDVTLAISSGGASPALARKFREILSTSKILEWADLVPLLYDVRKELRTSGIRVTPDHWQACLTEELLETYQLGNHATAHQKLLTALIGKQKASEYPKEND